MNRLYNLLSVLAMTLGCMQISAASCTEKSPQYAVWDINGIIVLGEIKDCNSSTLQSTPEGQTLKVVDTVSGVLNTMRPVSILFANGNANIDNNDELLGLREFIVENDLTISIHGYAGSLDPSHNRDDIAKERAQAVAIALKIPNRIRNKYVKTYTNAPMNMVGFTVHAIAGKTLESHSTQVPTTQTMGKRIDE